MNGRAPDARSGRGVGTLCSCLQTAARQAPLDKRTEVTDSAFSRSVAELDSIPSRMTSPPPLSALASTWRPPRDLGAVRGLRGRVALVEADYDAGLIDGRRYKVATEKVSHVEALRTPRPGS